FIDRKFGKKKVEYLHPILEEILKETYGIIVYQEQVIQIANKIGGLSLAEADILRRAMGKKDLQSMKAQKTQFIKGAIAKGISKKIAEEIFTAIDKFANYGFNKSHAVAYSYIAYQTAYLKAHYTAEFLAANLTNEFENTTKVTKFLEDCRRLKIEILPPDVNNPSVNFDVVDGKIQFGLSAIKNVGKGAVEEIIRSRDKLERDFTSIFDFCLNVDTRIVNKRALEGLVTAGAFDCCKASRASLFRSVELAIEHAHKVQNSKLSSGNSLFGETEEIAIAEPELLFDEPWGEKDRLAKEREVVGFYVTGHPLRKYEVEYKSFSNFHIGETEQTEEIENVRACGVITNVKTKIDRAGNKMAFFTIDDFSGSCECLMFSKVFAEYGKYVQKEEPVFVVGNLESSGDTVKMHVNKLIPIDTARNELSRSIRINIVREKIPAEKLRELQAVLETYPGKIPVFIQLFSNGNNSSLFALKNHRVELSNDLLKKLIEMFGEDSFLLVTK
ncbi:MAG: DNA polymerase III subunit alpha, partial [Ignavibacteriaceae bacterium]|nr:DNA polymerase III subunit alpha [Ignavibacteriaceae bacterium]